MSNKILISGAGPGAEDLITIRALKAVQEADLIVYAGSLVNPEILKQAKAESRKLNSAQMNLDEVIEEMVSAYNKGLQVLRLHSGDPALYGAISEQMNILEEKNIPFEVIPGVSCAFAAAAALQFEFTMPDITQTTILTRRAGRTPVPEKEHLRFLAANNASVILYLSIADIKGAVKDFLEAGRTPETPVAVVYRASWDNEKIIRGTLNDIAKKVEEAGIKRQALIIVSEALNRNGKKSLLYAHSFKHGYRKDEKVEFSGKIAVYAITHQGCHKAIELREGLKNAEVFVPKRMADDFSNTHSFAKNTLSKVIEDNWNKYDAHVFIMSAGIVLRKINNFIKSKLTDPAVVVCDEKGNYAISLLSGHIGGANRLSEEIAGITGGKAVITTATDVNKITAFDELASIQDWLVLNPEEIKTFNSMLLEKRNIDVLIPEDIFDKYYKNLKNLQLIQKVNQESKTPAVLFDTQSQQESPTLLLSSKVYTLGIGCRKNTNTEEIQKAVEIALDSKGISLSQIAVLGSTEKKQDETGLLEFAEENSLPCVFFETETLNSIKVPNKSPQAEKTFGLNSVAEASAIVAASDMNFIFSECIANYPEQKKFFSNKTELKLNKQPELIIEKTKTDKVTVAVARISY